MIQYFLIELYLLIQFLDRHCESCYLFVVSYGTVDTLQLIRVSLGVSLCNIIYYGIRLYCSNLISEHSILNISVNCQLLLFRVTQNVRNRQTVLNFHWTTVLDVYHLTSWLVVQTSFTLEKQVYYVISHSTIPVINSDSIRFKFILPPCIVNPNVFTVAYRM